MQIILEVFVSLSSLIHTFLAAEIIAIIYDKYLSKLAISSSIFECPLF